MDSYVVGLIVAACTAALGVGGATGLYSFNFGDHRENQHPEAVWRSANVRVGLSLVAYATLLGAGMLVARWQSPSLDTAVGVTLTIGAVMLLLGVRSGAKLIQESVREQRKGHLI